MSTSEKNNHSRYFIYLKMNNDQFNIKQSNIMQ